MASRRLSYAWTDLPFILVALVLLLPILVHLGGIILDFLASW